MNLSAYPSICSPESRFLASKEGLAQVCRTIGVVSLPIHVLTGYCILFKTPKEMSNVKNSLINLWFWCTTSQITLSFFFTPFNFYPHSASISAGFGTDLHVPTSVQFYIVFAINSAMLISIILLFENRSSMILENKFRFSINLYRVIWIFLNILGNFAVFTPVFLNLPEQGKAILHLLKTIPCPTKKYFLEPSVVFTPGTFWDTYLTSSFKLILLATGLQVLFFSSCCIYYLFVKSGKISMSNQTRRLQIRFFIGIIIQTFVPILLVLIPFTIFLTKGPEYNQTKNNIVMIFLCGP